MKNGMRKLTALVLGTVMLSAAFSVSAASDVVSIDGVDGTQFTGGVMEVTSQVNFADLFEDDGSNGTNGTVAVADDKGLKADKTDDGIRIHSILGSGNGIRPNALLYQKTYNMPQPANEKPYYVTFDFSVRTNCKLTFDFGKDGDSGVLQINRADRDVTDGSTKNAGYDIISNGEVKNTIKYDHDKELVLGFYVDPVSKTYVIYNDNEKLVGEPLSFNDSV